MSRAEKISGLTISELTQIGIYKIWFDNDVLKRVYIGSAIRNGKNNNQKGFLNRWNLHLSNLINNHNCTPKLQNAFNKYGLENIRFEIIEVLKQGEPISYYEDTETKYIKEFDAVEDGWNINVSGKNCKGTPMRKEVKDKIAAANRGVNNGMYNKYGYLNPMSKPVYQYDLNGKFIKKWDCAREIDRVLNIPYKQISQCFKTKSNFCKGYLWYNYDQGIIVDKYVKRNPIENLKRNKVMKLKEEYKNLSEEDLRVKIEQHFREIMKDVDIPTVTHYVNGLTSLVGKGYSLTMNTNAYWAYCNSVTENITKYIQEDFNK